MAFENVRPFKLDMSGFDNALSGFFGAVKQRGIEDATSELAGLTQQGAGRNALLDWAKRNPAHPSAQQFTNALARNTISPPQADPMAELRRRKMEAEVKRLEGGAPPDELKRLREEELRLRVDQMRNPQKDPVREMIIERLQRARGGQQPQAPATPQMPPQPQSAPGVPANPNIKLIADEQPPMAPQGQPQAPAMPEPDMVQTPFGPMSKQEATDLGGAMLLDPRYATAGRAILDAAQGGGAGLSKPAENQLDERTISAASTLGRLQEIKKQFRPEFLQIPDRLKMMGSAWGAKFGGRLAPQDQKQLQDFARFKATAFDNFNQLLKEMSGTAVSAQELSRQQIVQPNPGEGLFDGDDPVTFMSKIEQGERIAKAAVARMNFMRTQGLRFNKETAEQFMRLEDVPSAIRQRGSQIEQELRQTNPQADPMAIQEETKRRLKQEFGI